MEDNISIDFHNIYIYDEKRKVLIKIKPKHTLENYNYYLINNTKKTDDEDKDIVSLKNIKGILIEKGTDYKEEIRDDLWKMYKQTEEVDDKLDLYSILIDQMIEKQNLKKMEMIEFIERDLNLKNLIAARNSYYETRKYLNDNLVEKSNLLLKNQLIIDAIIHDIGNILQSIKGYIELPIDKRQIIEKNVNKDLEKANFSRELIKDLKSNDIEREEYSREALLEEFNNRLEMIIDEDNLNIEMNILIDETIIVGKYFINLVLYLLFFISKYINNNDPIIINILKDNDRIITKIDPNTYLKEDQIYELTKNIKRRGDNGSSYAQTLYILLLEQRYNTNIIIKQEEESTELISFIINEL